MSKVISCPVKRYTGEIVLPDYLSIIQYQNWIHAALELRDNPKALLVDYDVLLLKQAITLVEKWNLANFPKEPTIDTWPGTPNPDAEELRRWVINEIGKLVNSESELPNA